MRVFGDVIDDPANTERGRDLFTGQRIFEISVPQAQRLYRPDRGHLVLLALDPGLILRRESNFVFGERKTLKRVFFFENPDFAGMTGPIDREFKWLHARLAI